MFWGNILQETISSEYGMVIWGMQEQGLEKHNGACIHFNPCKLHIVGQSCCCAASISWQSLASTVLWTQIYRSGVETLDQILYLKLANGPEH